MFFYQDDDEEDDCTTNLSRIYCFVFREAKEGYFDDELRLHAFSLPESITKKQREDQKE